MDSKSEENVVKLMRSLTEMKSNLTTYLKENYQNYLNVNSSIDDIRKEFDSLYNRLTTIDEKAKEIKKEKKKIDQEQLTFQKQIGSVLKMQKFLTNLLEIHEKIQSLTKRCEYELVLDEKIIISIAEEVVQLTELLMRSDSKKEDLNLFVHLQKSAINLKVNLSLQAQKLLNKSIQCRTENIAQKSNIYSINVYASNSTIKALFNLLKCIQSSREFSEQIIHFIANDIIYRGLENHILMWNLNAEANNKHEASQSGDTLDSDAKYSIQLRVLSSHNTTEISANKLKNLIEVKRELLINFKESVELLHRSFLSGKLFEPLLLQEFDEKLTKMLLDSILEPFCDCKLFLDVINDLDKCLKACKWISEQNDDLKNIVMDFEQLTISNDANIVLRRVREKFISSTSLLNCESVVEINKDPIMNEGIEDYIKKQFDSQNEDVQDLLKTAHLVDLSHIQFPNCKVSSSVADLISGLITEIKDKISLLDLSQPKEEDFEKLYELLRIVPQALQLYLWIVPISNKQVLRDVPLASVIHFNNCQYLAHQSLFWPTYIYDIIKDLDKLEIERRSSNSNKTERLVETVQLNKNLPKLDVINQNHFLIIKSSYSALLPLVYKFRDAAQTCLSDQVQEAKERLVNLVMEYGDMVNVGGDKREKVEMSLLRMTKLIGNLSQVYESLPQSVSDKIFGELLEVSVKKLSNQILSIEDMVSKDCMAIIDVVSHWISEIKGILCERETEKRNKYINSTLDSTSGMTISCESSEDGSINSSYLDAMVTAYLAEYCPKWNKLNQILTVLQSGLLELEDLWYKSQLNALSLDEMRSLVKATFQNNNARSAFLTRIANNTGVVA